VDIVNMGINGGYAYTFVWKEALFISLSASLGPSLSNNLVHNSSSSSTSFNKLSVGMTTSYRISLGFNSNAYYVGLSVIRFSMSNMIWDEGDWFTYSSGNIRLNVVKRFHLKRPIKILRPDLWIF